MKKASKFLSMFLLVAMCFSLLGGAAYATSSDPFAGSFNGGSSTVSGSSNSDSYSDSYSGTVVSNASNNSNSVVIAASGTSSSSTPAMYASKDLVWKTGSYYRATLAEIIQLGTAITLQNDVTDSSKATLAKNYVINLNGKTLTLGDSLFVNTSVTIKNGTIVNPEKITVSAGTLTLANVTIGDATTAAKVDDITNVASGAAVKIDNTVDPVAKIGSTGYATAQEAFEAAAKMTGNVTITFPDYDNTTSDYDLTADVAINCDTLTLVLNNNSLNLAGHLTINSNLSVSGYMLNGDVTVTNKNVTLASNTNVSGTIKDTNGTVTVNGGTVNEVDIENGTLVMSSGTVSKLTINNDNDSYQYTLSVGGGTVGSESNKVTLPANYKTAAVTGGNWYLSDDSTQVALLKANANNKTVTKNDTKGYYTVGTGTGTVISSVNSNGSTTSGDSYSQVAGSYTVDGFTYTTTTSGDVAVWPVSTATWSSGNGNLYFYYTPNTAAANGKTYSFYLDSSAWQIPGESYTDNLAGTMSIGKSLLADLSEGVHTVYLVCDGKTASCTFYIPGSLKAVDTDKHVINSTKSLQFYSTQPISRVWVGDVEITDNYGTYYTLSSDRKTLTLTADFLNDRTAGNTYTLTVQTDAGSTLSSTFQVLTTAQASSSPKTGDASNLALWAAVLVLSGGAAIAVLPRVKKNED
jgi:hypothetical protein